MKKKSEDLEFEDMLGLVATQLRNPKPNHLQYLHQFDPDFTGIKHEKQIEFHASQAKGRQFLGGNRSGKTVAGINEDIMWSRGKHPFIDLPNPPIIGRIVTVDFKNGAAKIILPQLAQWIPPSELINGSWEDSYNGHLNVLKLANDSEIEIMSHEQDLEKFAGVPRHWIHFDEECPKDIYKECLARLVDYNGRWWMTMTPVEGMTWTYEDIYEQRHTELIDVIQVDVNDNPHLNQEGKTSVLSGYDEDEKLIRGRGRYIAISGLIFKQFDPEVHVIPEGIPLPVADWEYYVSLDAGYNNPTAIYWHAVRRSDGCVVTFNEHYRREWTVEQHANYLLELERQFREQYGIIPFLRVADPAIKQRQQVTGLSIQIEYANHGVNWATSRVKDVNAGLDKMINYLRLGKWFITENCPALQREMRKYRRSQYATSKLREQNNAKEEPQKKDDHAIDSSRYFFSFMPVLNPQMPTPAKVEKPNLLGAPTLVVDRPYVVDTNLVKAPSTPMAYDEYTGEW